MKYFNNIKEIKKTEGKILEIKNFFSINEVNKILKYKANSKIGLSIFLNRK